MCKNIFDKTVEKLEPSAGIKLQRLSLLSNLFRFLVQADKA